MIFLADIDGMGIVGNFYHYSMVMAFVGSAFLIFLCLWRKKRLDIDEEPKYQMLEEDVNQGEKHDGERE